MRVFVNLVVRSHRRPPRKLKKRIKRTYLQVIGAIAKESWSKTRKLNVRIAWVRA
jgi:hypothetical protein